MKILIWCGFVLLTLLWTGGVALMALITEWLLMAAASGQVTDLLNHAEKWPVPAWLGLWVDTGLVQSLQASMVDMAQWFIAVMPSSANAVGWIIPVFWIIWGIVTFMLLAAAIFAHWLVNKKAWLR
jgi:hypothetical protein